MQCADIDVQPIKQIRVISATSGSSDMMGLAPTARMAFATLICGHIVGDVGVRAVHSLLRCPNSFPKMPASSCCIVFPYSFRPTTHKAKPPDMAYLHKRAPPKMKWMTLECAKNKGVFPYVGIIQIRLWVRSNSLSAFGSLVLFIILFLPCLCQLRNHCTIPHRQSSIHCARKERCVGVPREDGRCERPRDTDCRVVPPDVAVTVRCIEIVRLILHLHIVGHDNP